MVSEVNTWKEKFREMSAQYRNAAEELTLRNAELDNLRKERTEISLTKSTVRA